MKNKFHKPEDLRLKTEDLRLKTEDLRLKSEEVLADVRSAAWLEQELHPEADRHRRHQMADICEADNIERVWRVLSVAVAELRLELSGLLLQEKETASENQLEHPEEWGFSFAFPLTMSAKGYLREKIHQYLVASVMADRTETILPPAAAIWRERAATDLSMIRGVAATAHPPHCRIRRPLWPL